MDPATFLEHYGFELEGQSGQVWVEHWSKLFPTRWIPAALIEALYQGRYKATSVEQILRLWQRRGCPHLTFPPEISQSLWWEQQELIRSLALAARTATPRPHSSTTPQVAPECGSLIPPAISLNFLLGQLQDLPPKLRHLISSPDPAPLGRQSETTLGLHPTVADPPDPTEHPQGQT
ncbi:MAG: hypothetical protein Q6L60_06785 [Thermostichus sp. HHBFW_bins_43]